MTHTEINHSALELAFKINTSGNGRCYYGANIDGVQYEGERDWDARWVLIKDCMDFAGKRVLDIGCNMGILMSYLRKFSGAEAAGIDEPDDMLAATNKSNTMAAARMLEKGLGLDHAPIYQIDLNASDYEGLIGTGYDVAVAMSILRWIDDQDRFMRYLACFPAVIYEGHEADDVEIARFAAHGFAAKVLGQTQTGKSYDPNHTRTLILFTK